MKPSKIPIVNIETPSLSGIPDNIKNMLENTALPEYNIANGRVQSPYQLREQLTHDYVHAKHPFMKNVDSVRKSILSDGNMFNDVLHGDDAHVQANKGKMSEEELEALQEDESARSLMKNSADKSKSEEQPEILGLGKQGMSPADKALISASLSNGEQTGIDTSSVDDLPTLNSAHKNDAEKHFKAFHDDIPLHDPTLPSEGTKSAYPEVPSEHAVDKANIIDSDLDRTMSEIANYHDQGKAKSSEYESFDNGNDQHDHEGKIFYTNPNIR